MTTVGCRFQSIVYLLVLLLIHSSLGKWSGDPEIINYSKYYYLSIRAKMSESLSASNCSIGGAALGFKYGDKRADLQVKVLEPDKLVRDLYEDFKIKTSFQGTVYFQTNSVLCTTGVYVLQLQCTA